MAINQEYVEILSGLVNYKQLEIDDRKHLLRKIKDYYLEYMGIYDRNIDVSLIFDTNCTSYGFFTENYRAIHIKDNKIETNFLSAVDTLLHEIRHAYQYYIVNQKPEKECDEKECLMRINTTNYASSPSFTKNEENQKRTFDTECQLYAYYNNDIEIDARDFACDILMGMISNASAYFNQDYKEVYAEAIDNLENVEANIQEQEQKLHSMKEDINLEIAKKILDFGKVLKNYEYHDESYYEKIANYRLLADRYNIKLNLDFFKGENDIFYQVALSNKGEVDKFPVNLVKVFREAAFKEPEFFDRFVLPKFDVYAEEIGFYCKQGLGKDIYEKLLPYIENSLIKLIKVEKTNELIRTLLIDSNTPIDIKHELVSLLVKYETLRDGALRQFILRYDCPFEVRKMIQKELISCNKQYAKAKFALIHDVAKRGIYTAKQQKNVGLIVQNVNFPNNDMAQRKDALKYLMDNGYYLESLEVLLHGNIDEATAISSISTIVQQLKIPQFLTNFMPKFENGIMTRIISIEKCVGIYSIMELFFSKVFDNNFLMSIIKDTDFLNSSSLVHTATNRKCSRYNRDMIIEFCINNNLFQSCADMIAKNCFPENLEDKLFSAIPSQYQSAIVNLIANDRLKEKTKNRFVNMLMAKSDYSTISQIASQNKCSISFRGNLINFLLENDKISKLPEEILNNKTNENFNRILIDACIKNGYAMHATMILGNQNKIKDNEKLQTYERISKINNLGCMVLLERYFSAPDDMMNKVLLQSEIVQSIKDKLSKCSVQKGNIFYSDGQGSFIDGFADFFALLNKTEKNELALMQLNYYKQNNKESSALCEESMGSSTSDMLLNDAEIDTQLKSKIIDYFIDANLANKLLNNFKYASCDEFASNYYLERLSSDINKNISILSELIIDSTYNVKIRNNAVDILVSSKEFNALEFALCCCTEYDVVEERILKQLSLENQTTRLENIINSQIYNLQNIERMLKICCETENTKVLSIFFGKFARINKTNQGLIESSVNKYIQHLLKEKNYKKLIEILDANILTNSNQNNLRLAIENARNNLNNEEQNYFD